MDQSIRNSEQSGTETVVVRIGNRRRLLLFASLITVAFASHAFASEAADKLLAKTYNTPATRAGKALSDCLLVEVDKAKASNMSTEDFQQILVNACPDQVSIARQTLADALREMKPDKQWTADDDKAVDFGILAVRARVYQIFTGVRKPKIAR